MKPTQKMLAISALLATSLFSASAIAKTTKAAPAPAADPAVIENKMSDEQKLGAYLGQGYRVCMNNASLFADVSQMRQSGVSEAEAKKKLEEAVQDAPKEAQDKFKENFKSLVENIYKNQPVQKTDAEKHALVQDVLFDSFYQCAVDVGYSLAGAK